jgi:hypothetical protein
MIFFASTLALIGSRFMFYPPLLRISDQCHCFFVQHDFDHSAIMSTRFCRTGSGLVDCSRDNVARASGKRRWPFRQIGRQGFCRGSGLGSLTYQDTGDVRAKQLRNFIHDTDNDHI